MAASDDRLPPSSGLPFVPLLLALLAFLLASSVARNSDVWLHLARGRWLAHGEFTRSMADPIAPGVAANSSWLYDLVCYGVYSPSGQTGLLVGKAFLIARCSQ
jgi:hypothetical protein